MYIYIYIYTYYAHEIDKLRLQILEALHKKLKKNKLKSIDLILKIATMFLNSFSNFFRIP